MSDEVDGMQQLALSCQSMEDEEYDQNGRFIEEKYGNGSMFGNTIDNDDPFVTGRFCDAKG